MLRSTTKPRAISREGVCCMKQRKIGVNITALVEAEGTRRVLPEARWDALRGLETSLV
jgi:hypothetical protein